MEYSEVFGSEKKYIKILIIQFHKEYGKSIGRVLVTLKDKYMVKDKYQDKLFLKISCCISI